MGWVGVRLGWGWGVGWGVSGVPVAAVVVAVALAVVVAVAVAVAVARYLWNRRRRWRSSVLSCRESRVAGRSVCVEPLELGAQDCGMGSRRTT